MKKGFWQNNKTKILLALFGLLLVGVSFLAGWQLNTYQNITIRNVREESDAYHFISPLLFVSNPESRLPEFISLKNAISYYVNSEEVKQKTIDISIYYRDLNSSQWVGINPEEKFSAASMLKVATLIAVLRAAESKPSLLSTDVYVTSSKSDENEERNQDYYPPQNPIEVGETYNVQELLNHLIIESDNAANHILYQLIDSANIKKTYDDLEIPMASSSNQEVNTAQNYSHLFRTLYNATYLSRSVSEKVLDLLSRTTFTEGIVAGVPPGTVVSHKFGERNLVSSTDQNTANLQNTKELHDCGIVYYPAHPYFICIMTKGSDYPTLASVIQGVSKVVWEKIDAQY